MEKQIEQRLLNAWAPTVLKKDELRRRFTNSAEAGSQTHTHGHSSNIRRNQLLHIRLRIIRKRHGDSCERVVISV